MRAREALVPLLNRQGPLDGRPFDPATDAHTLRGRWGIVHYGVMIPGLPEPFRFFNAIVILGAPRAPIFDNEPLRTTRRSDAAWVLTGTAAVRDGFRHYDAEKQCEVGPDDASLRFADHVHLARTGSHVELRCSLDDLEVDLTLELTPAISHFAHIPGLYDHWSVLGRYEGTFDSGSGEQRLTGLCTYEYARGVNAPLPFLRSFAYQILNVSDTTQVLMVEVVGNHGIVVQRTVYVRDSDGRSTRHTRGFRHEIHQLAPEPLTTPDGFAMPMPQSFSWNVQDDDGSELVAIDATSNADFRYGLGAGYAGSYSYTGTFRGRPISGTAYQEWIDRR